MSEADDANLKRTIDALVLAGPWALLPRFPGDPRHCIPASYGGAQALRAHGVEANPLPCMALAFTASKVFCSGVGAGSTAREMYAAIGRIVPRMPPFGDFERIPQIQANVGRITGGHMVIEARVGEARAVVDLTSAQISNQYISVPNGLRWTGEGWATIRQADGTEVFYRAASSPSEVLETSRSYVGPDYRVIGEDMATLMRLAYRHGLNEREFAADLSGRRHQSLRDGMTANSSLWITPPDDV